MMTLLSANQRSWDKSSLLSGKAVQSPNGFLSCAASDPLFCSAPMSACAQPC